MTEKIKIAHLTSVHSDYDVRIFYKECKTLAASGFQVAMILPNAEERVEDQVQVISFQHKLTSRFDRAKNVVNKILKKALEFDADIYHLHDPELLRIGVKLIQKGKKVVYDSHEDLPRQVLSKGYLPNFSKKIISRKIEKWENKRVKQMSGVVAATPYIKDRFLKVNPNTIDVNNYPIIMELTSDSSYVDKSEDLICYVGGITRIRGIVEIIESIQDLDVQLLLAGKFLEPGLREEVSARPSWNKVIELGFLNRDEIKEIYRKSKLGLVTLYPISNYLDALPVKMFEYMAAGIPVVASDFPLWRSIIEDNEAGICVDPKNPKQIELAIKMILEDSKLAEKMGANGKRLILEKYNWRIESKKLIELYLKLN